MPSITTQNVASASAALVQQQPPPAAAQSNATAKPQEIIKATQVAAAEQTHRARRKDEARTTQTPKRAEGAFASQPQYTRQKRKTADGEDTSEQPADKDPGMDVVA